MQYLVHFLHDVVHSAMSVFSVYWCPLREKANTYIHSSISTPYTHYHTHQVCDQTQAEKGCAHVAHRFLQTGAARGPGTLLLVPQVRAGRGRGEQTAFSRAGVPVHTSSSSYSLFSRFSPSLCPLPTGGRALRMKPSIVLLTCCAQRT